MKLADIRSMTAKELQTKLDSTREELMNLRFQMAMGSLTDFTRLRQTRQLIARIITVQLESDAGKKEGQA